LIPWIVPAIRYLLYFEKPFNLSALTTPLHIFFYFERLKRETHQRKTSHSSSQFPSRIQSSSIYIQVLHLHYIFSAFPQYPTDAKRAKNTGWSFSLPPFYLPPPFCPFHPLSISLRPWHPTPQVQRRHIDRFRYHIRSCNLASFSIRASVLDLHHASSSKVKDSCAKGVQDISKG